MFSVKKNALQAFLEAAKNTYPHEFICLLSGNKKNKIIEEIVIVPSIFVDTFSSIKQHLVPFDENYIGTAHSHPSDSNKPSRQDVSTFSKMGEIHFIAKPPFSLYDLAAYDQKGKATQIKIN